MGAWGTGPFDNDLALDMVHQLIHGSEILRALRSFVGEKGDVYDDPHAAFAAVWLMISDQEDSYQDKQTTLFAKHNHAYLPTEIIDWIQQKKFVYDIEQLDLAHEAVKRLKLLAPKEGWEDLADRLAILDVAEKRIEDMIEKASWPITQKEDDLLY